LAQVQLLLPFSEVVSAKRRIHYSVLDNFGHAITTGWYDCDIFSTFIEIDASGFFDYAGRIGVCVDGSSLLDMSFSENSFFDRNNKKLYIPIAAGMAGGSTDAAAAMRAVNELFELNRPLEELEKHAVKIGADVPYCIQGGTVLSEGIGEVLTKLPNAPQCILLIAKPDIMVSTKYVYENLNLPELKKHPDIDLMVEAIKEGDAGKMIEPMDNVLATVTEEKYGIIKEIKQTMQRNGAIKAMMSGSGPTVFGIFETMVQAATAFDAIKEKGMAREIFISKFINPQEEE
jgi:4-diphosphocytidyl-2C-methyl-D-erythritol kinase